MRRIAFAQTPFIGRLFCPYRHSAKAGLFINNLNRLYRLPVLAVFADMALAN